MSEYHETGSRRWPPIISRAFVSFRIHPDSEADSLERLTLVLIVITQMMRKLNANHGRDA